MHMRQALPTLSQVTREEMEMFRSAHQRLGDGSAVTSTGCSSRGPRCGLLNSVPGDRIPFPDLLGLLDVHIRTLRLQPPVASVPGGHLHMWCTLYMQASAYTYKVTKFKKC